MKAGCGKIQQSGGEFPQDPESGQAIVEFALAFPLQLLIIFAIIQLALIYVAKQVVTYASYAATRSAMVAETREEAEDRASRTAALVCAPITGGTITGSAFSWGDLTRPEAVIEVPGWGVIPKSGISYRLKTYTHTPDFSTPGEVTVTVCHYYELIMPVVSKVFAWSAGEGFMSDRTEIESGIGQSGSSASDEEASFEATTGIWNIRNADHIRLRSTTTLVIPGTEEERLAAAAQQP